MPTLDRHGTSVQLCPRCLKALKGFFELWELPIDDGPARTRRNLLICQNKLKSDVTDQ
jgi:hypothetical protein